MRIQQEDEPQPDRRREIRRRPHDRPKQHRGADGDADRPSSIVRHRRSSVAQDSTMDDGRSTMDDRAAPTPPFRKWRARWLRTPRRSRSIARWDSRKVDVVPVVDQQVVGFEHEPRAESTRREKEEFVAMAHQPRRPRFLINDAVDEQDVAGPGDGRVPRPERLDPREHPQLRYEQECETDVRVKRHAEKFTTRDPFFLPVRISRSAARPSDRHGSRGGPGCNRRRRRPWPPAPRRPPA